MIIFYPIQLISITILLQIIHIIEYFNEIYWTFCWLLVIKPFIFSIILYHLYYNFTHIKSDFVDFLLPYIIKFGIKKFFSIIINGFFNGILYKFVIVEILLFIHYDKIY